MPRPSPSTPTLRRRMAAMLRTLSFFALMALLACSTEPRADTAKLPSATPRILWDTWGIPHIDAPDPLSLSFALGWSQCRNHADLLLRLYGESRGRAAEYWGPAQLDSDKRIWTMGIPQRSQRWLQELKPEYRAMTEAFARGINACAAAHGDLIDPAVRQVLPVTAADVMSHYQRVIHFTFVAGPDALSAPLAAWPRGSNAWAIAPSHSTSGRALLLANPHLPWSSIFTWHEAHLLCPASHIGAGRPLDLYGATLVGFPFLAIASNTHLGWTHTVNTYDGADLYEVTAEADHYRFDGRDIPFELERHTLKIRQPDGSFTTHDLIVRKTLHGPVIAEKPLKALALRVAGLDAPHVLEQYWGMATARNLAEFQVAQSMLQMPLFTTLYADRDGHIMHLFGGRVPQRPSGDWRQWTGIVPGDSPGNLWTTTLPYRELPRVTDPPTGWLQNANDPPWTTTIPAAIRPDDFPPYIAPRLASPATRLRAQRSIRLVTGEPRMTFESLIRAKYSTRVEMADRLLDDLAAAVRAHGDSTAHRAMEILSRWDRCTEPDSRGAVLFLRWVQKVGLNPFATAASEVDALDTPDGLADPANAAAALSAAAAQLESAFGTADVEWGRVYRLKFGDIDQPSNGGPGALGIFRNVEYRPIGDGRFYAIGGDSFVAVTEFSDHPRMAALLPYGNATQPGSPHRGDQFQLFLHKKLRPVWRTRQEIESHLESTEDLPSDLAPSGTLPR